VGDCGVIVARFHGNFSFTVDSKGRVNIPAKFRSSLNPAANETFTICRGPDGCLRAYPSDLWEAYETELLALPETEETLRLKRLLYATLTDSTLDAQGRITLSSTQMKNAGITKDVVLIGQANYVEIWDADRHSAYYNRADDFNDVFYHSVGAGIPKS